MHHRRLEERGQMLGVPQDAEILKHPHRGRHPDPSPALSGTPVLRPQG
jgi:hypothetical protein